MLTLQNQTGKGCLDLRRAMASAPDRGEHKPFLASPKKWTFFLCLLYNRYPLSLVWVQLPFAPEAPADKRRAAPKSGGRALIGGGFSVILLYAAGSPFYRLWLLLPKFQKRYNSLLPLESPYK